MNLQLEFDDNLRRCNLSLIQLDFKDKKLFQDVKDAEDSLINLFLQIKPKTQGLMITLTSSDDGV